MLIIYLSRKGSEYLYNVGQDWIEVQTWVENTTMVGGPILSVQIIAFRG
jgi:hypothetical protein